jgi:DNA-binding NtrC family response regulator
VLLLIVDDDPAVRTALVRLLGLRHKVTAAKGFVEACEMLASEAPFDVVLCDVVMPDGTGLELLHYIERTRPALAGRVVLMTGGAATREDEEALKVARAEVITKPFDLAILDAALARALKA